MKTAAMTMLLSLALVTLAAPQNLFCRQNCAPAGFDPQDVVRSVRRNRGLAEANTPALGRAGRLHHHRGRVSGETASKKQLTDEGEFLIDTSIASVGEPSNQYHPAVAFDGTNYLVVWQDWRDNPNSPYVYGCRVTPTGIVLDPLGIPISNVPVGEGVPAIAFGSTNFLVVWMDGRNGNNWDIYGTRVTPAGIVLDPLGIPISTAADNQMYPAVAFNNSSFLVVWGDYRNGELDIYGARISPAGVVSDSLGIPISTAADDQFFPAVAFDGTNCLVVWEDWRSGPEPDIYGARVNPTGVVLDPLGIAISIMGGHQRNPAIAFGGANYLVVWNDWRSGRDIYGARVTPVGTVLDPQGIAISTAVGEQWFPIAAFDGTNYLVTWQDNRSGGYYDIYGARVGPAGVVLDTHGLAISTAAEDQLYPAVVSGGANYLVVWHDWRSGDCDIYGARVSPAGTVLEPQGILISTVVHVQESPAVASDGTNFLVVWQDDRNGSDWDIYGARVSLAGTVLDPRGFAISTAEANQESPAVAFDGTNFLVVWQDDRNSDDWDIYGARISPAGTVLEPQGIPIATAENDQESPAVAFDGSNFLTVWEDWRSGAECDVYGARVSTAGAVLEPQGIVISDAAVDQESPAVAFDGTNFLVVWQDGRNSDDWDIYGTRISPAGTVLEPQGIAVSTMADDQESPAVAFDGTNFLVVWQDDRNGDDLDIYGARISPAGTVLEPQGIPISTAEDDQESPAIAYDGTNFLTVWEDWRSGNECDIYAARISPIGTVLDEWPVVQQEGNQHHPAIVRGTSSRTFLVYQGWTGTVGGRAYNTQRIWGKLNLLSELTEMRASDVCKPDIKPTIVRGILILPSSGVTQGTSSVLLDISGRKVMELRAGTNDISGLSPGVYFVRKTGVEMPTGTVLKAIVQR